MLRIGICDDEAAAREALQFALEKQLRGESEYFSFSSGERLLGWMGRHAGELDLLFLDVEMPDLDGLETARRLRAAGYQMPLAFCTGYTDFVFDGYTVGAVDYLVKPVRQDKLAALLERVRERLEAEAPRTYIVQNTEGLFRLPVADILYCYSDRRLVHVVTDKREYPFYAKLDDVAAELGNGFVRIHQRYLVSVRAVMAVERDNVRLGNVSLPISRGLKQEALLALTRAMMEGGGGS